MALSKDWREFLELLNSSGVDYVIVGAQTLARASTHDRLGKGWMLQTDALSATLFIVGALFVLQKTTAARATASRERQYSSQLELRDCRDG